MADQDNVKALDSDQEDKKAEKKEPKVKKEKFRFIKKTGKFFKDCRSELKKVVWASRKTTTNETVLVILAIIIVAAVIGTLDYLFANAIELIGALY